VVDPAICRRGRGVVARHHHLAVASCVMCIAPRLPDVFTRAGESCNKDPVPFAVVSVDYETAEGRAAAGYLRALGCDVLLGTDGLQSEIPTLVVASTCNASRPGVSDRMIRIRQRTEAPKFLWLISAPGKAQLPATGMIETVDELCAAAVSSGHFRLTS
jgi:hypothetical protein